MIPAQEPRPTSGSRLGPYQIESELGHGGMGRVFRARDTRLGRVVAIKLIRSDLAQRVDLRSRFEREARALSALNHPHICSLYDIGEQDGCAYLVMEYVEGETLASLLRKGIDLPLALRYAAEIADALSAAHEAGITHRDLKPANIMIARGGVKVLDFGLAKRTDPVQLGDEGETRSMDQATRAGEILGTVAYMSPEQAEGVAADARSDVFALGVVLYELLCGKRPFEGETTLSTLASILRETPDPPRKLRREIPERVERVVLRCLEKKPEARFSSATDVHKELAQYQTVKARSKKVRPALVAAIVAALIVVGGLGWQAALRISRARWAETDALPEITRLLEKNHLASALPLYREAAEYAPASRGLLGLSEILYVLPVAIDSTPPGAQVDLVDYRDTDAAHWQSLGQTPFKTERIPFRGYYRIRVTKDGFEPVELTFSPGGTQTLRIQLHTPQSTPKDMVWLPPIAAGAYLSPAPSLAVPEFWLDKYEVTNRQYKEFVDAGGYQKQQFWKEALIKNGRRLSWEEAMMQFRDATGKPGPATWQLGSYPEGKADYPVAGVSWYEAAAYAEFAQKSLPTMYHWYRAAAVGFFSDILSLSNFSGLGPAPVGMNRGIGAYGSYDMAGNVKEWVATASGELRYILGAGWNEPDYHFADADARLPFDRDVTFGFRCAKHPAPVPEVLSHSFEFPSRDRSGDKPLDEQAYNILRELQSYKKAELKPLVQSVDNSSPYLRREDVSFQAAYGDERVIAHLYLPKNAAPPYQAVLFGGSGGIVAQRSIEENHDPFEFIVRSGRALIFPAFKGTLERGPMPSQGREARLRWSMDIGRSIDYLETRPEIDITKLAYYGYSASAAASPRFIAMEPRFKVSLLVSGGATPKGPPELDPWNYEPHVTIPVLMLNGKNDFTFPLETSQNPFFRALGTPEKDKKHVLFDGGHVNLMTRMDLVKEALDWLDHYLGPVATH